MNHRKKLAAIMAVALLLAVSVAVPYMAEDASAEDETQDLISEYSEIYGFAPIVVAAIIIGVSYVAGKIIGNLMSDPGDGAGDQEDINKQLRQMKADDWALMMDTIKDIASSIIPADTTLWSFTSSYWNRAVELVVAELWSADSSYDAEVAVYNSLLRTNAENYLYNWQSTLDKSYNNVLKSRLYMNKDPWDEMTLSLVWNQGSIEATTSESEDFTFDLTQIIQDAKANSTVWIDARAEDEEGTALKSTSSTIYNLGTSSVTLTKQRVFQTDSVGTTITLSPGKSYKMSSDESGLYTITAGATVAGPFTKAASNSAADVQGALVFTGSDDTIYAIASNDVLKIGHAGISTLTTAQSLMFQYTFTGTDETSTTSVICDGTDYNLVRDWNNMVQQINDVIDKAATAGEAIWGIFDAAEQSSAFISPSAFTTTVKGMDLTAAEQQAVYVQALMQVADYWEESEGKLTTADFITNVQSTDLYVYGDIYYNGTLWAENVIFTPYLTVTEEQTLTVDTETSWIGPGFAQVWAQVDSYSEWDGSTSTTNQALVNLDSNYSIQVKKIIKEGTEISTITLSPTIIKRYTTDPTPITPTPDAVQVLDGSSLIMIIIIELAIILFLLGRVFNQPVAGAVAAVIALVIGFAFQDTITSIALGTFSWSDLL